jgi:hypothetical protein
MQGCSDEFDGANRVGHFYDYPGALRVERVTSESLSRCSATNADAGIFCP